jgi:hypothetical protein
VASLRREADPVPPRLIASERRLIPTSTYFRGVGKVPPVSSDTLVNALGAGADRVRSTCGPNRNEPDGARDRTQRRQSVSEHENCRELSTKSAEALGVTRGSFVWVDNERVPPVRLGLQSFEPTTGGTDCSLRTPGWNCTCSTATAGRSPPSLASSGSTGGRPADTPRRRSCSVRNGYGYGSRRQTVGAMGETDRAALLALPAEPFDAARVTSVRVDAKARVCVRQSFYSVPARYAGRRLVARIEGTTIEVTDASRVVAVDERSIVQGTQTLVLDHYLEILVRKPGAMPGALATHQAREAGVLTRAHVQFWARARRRHGDAGGTRALIEVLLLHRGLPFPAVHAALEAVNAAGSVDSGLVANRRPPDHRAAGPDRLECPGGRPPAAL